LAKELVSQLSSISKSDNLSVIDYDLSFYDTQPPDLIGLEKDFISSARLDNLLSCFAGVQAIIKTNKQVTSMLACYDHEEVGSTSAIGANGAFMESVLNRLFRQAETKSRVVANSMLISTDNAHGVHPNFLDKHDENHSPIINNGLVIKVNANQRYATDSLTSSLLKNLCNDINIPTQSFVNRADMSCGSTIGPITAANIGIKTIDIGVPTFAMHSIREIAGKEDAFYLFQMLSKFLDAEKL
jgi:aspartyl aminopeptidase